MKFRRKSGIHRYVDAAGEMHAVFPGEIYEGEKEDLGRSLDLWEQLDPDPPLPEPTRPLKAMHRGFGKWDVVSQATGMPINNEPLSKEEAYSLAGISALELREA